MNSPPADATLAVSVVVFCLQPPNTSQIIKTIIMPFIKYKQLTDTIELVDR